MSEAKGLKHGKRQAGEGPSGHLQPEIPVRHTFGWERNAADREPLCINIAPRGGRLQALLLAPPPYLIGRPICARTSPSGGPRAADPG
jgi:hypothetical protein